jgi:hypothetical protein
MTEQQPVVDERGDERHPAFGRVILNRMTSSHGISLFDSEIKHTHVVTLSIQGATRKRDLNRDWIYPDSTPLVEIQMSEAQWASMISSFHDGGGTSCTISYTKQDGHTQEIPFAPRMQHSMDEVKEAAHRQYAKVLEALRLVEEKPNKGNIKHLRTMLENADRNVAYTAKSMTEHAENVVQKARADIEAMVVQHAEHLGLNPSDVTATLQLGPASTEEASDGQH